MRDKPHTGTLERPDPRRDPFQWAGERVAGGEQQSREHGQFSEERDQKRPLPRPKTSIGLVSCDILYYSDRYRRRSSIAKSGHSSTTATPVSLNAQPATNEQASGHRQHHHHQQESTQAAEADGHCIVVDRADTFLIDEAAKRSIDASSSRPRTSQRRLSDYKVSHTDGDRRIPDGDVGILNARVQQHHITEDVSADVVRRGSYSRERRTSSSGSAVSDPFRRRSYNSVAFTAPHDREAKVVISVPRPPPCRSNKFRTLKSRRMSAPELPPIVDNKGRPHGVHPRVDKRNSLTSGTGNRSSIVQQTPSVKNKTFTSRLPITEPVVNQEATKTFSGAEKVGKKKKGILPRNFSEPTLSGLLGNASTQSHESSSTNRSLSTYNADALSGSGSKQMKFFSNANRALSWCAIDNVGSQNKLETLFEGKVQHHGAEGDTAPAPKSPPPAQSYMPYVKSKASSSSSVNNVISLVSSANNVSYDANNNNNNSNINDVAAGQTRSRKDASRLQSLDPSETPRGRFHRSSSENKHMGKSLKHDISQRQERKSTQPMSRNQSLDRIDKLVSSQRTHNKPAAESKPGTYRLRRASSNIVLSNNVNNNREDDYDNDYPEDDRDLLNKVRIEQWLNIVNNVDQYDTDPKDIDFDYMDEIPQTDTAIHVVYEGD
ncbi:hypothetical protein Btru_020087 [Bulinus truncatus]|nr:hypothetical protein Btru_020087 [Bulinus truncatus]